jgi:hypothetical protein
MSDQLIEHKKMVAQANTQTRVQKMVKRNQCLEALKVMSINSLQSQFDRETPQY